MIEIEGPDGSVYEFPDGTSDDVIRSAMRKQFGGPETRVERPAVGGHAAAMQGIQQGLTFGFGDELMAGMMTPVEAIKGAVTGEDSGKGLVARIGDAYDRNLARERLRTTDAREQHPVISTAGEVAGGLVTGGQLAKGGATLLNVAKPTMPAMIGRGAAEGALYGAAYGAGEGEGLEDRLNKAIWGGAVGGATGGALGAVGARGAQRAAQQAVPDTEALKAASNALYKEADNAGVILAPKSFSDGVDDIAITVLDAGLDPTLHPRATAAMARLNQAKGQPLTLKQFDTLRRIVNGAAKSIEPDEQRVAGIMIDKLDDYFAKVDPTEVIAGDPRAAQIAIDRARKLWGQMRRSELMDDITARVDLDAQKFSVSGKENALRANFRQLAKNKKLMRQFTEEEQKAIRKVAIGGPVENVARLIGKAAPTGAVSTGAGAGVGFMLGGPAGAMAVPAIGAAGRGIATRMTGNHARAAESLIRNGGVVPELQALSGPQRAMIELLMKGSAPQDSRIGQGLGILGGMTP